MPAAISCSFWLCCLNDCRELLTNCELEYLLSLNAGLNRTTGRRTPTTPNSPRVQSLPACATTDHNTAPRAEPAGCLHHRYCSDLAARDWRPGQTGRLPGRTGTRPDGLFQSSRTRPDDRLTPIGDVEPSHDVWRCDSAPSCVP